MKYFIVILKSVFLAWCLSVVTAISAPPAPGPISRAQPLVVIGPPPPATNGWLCQPVPALVSACKSVRIDFSPSPDLTVVAYKLVHCDTANGNYFTMTNVISSNTVFVKNAQWNEFFQVVGVTADGLNGLGNYQ